MTKKSILLVTFVLLVATAAFGGQPDSFKSLGGTAG